jgi:DNA-binding transcriptional LysR family regulator
VSGADELAVFVKVVEEGSFTAAAHALDMPKSSISRNIARLEERLGVLLLHRTTRSLSTTEAGAVFYERCVRIVAEIAAAEEALSGRPVTPRGPVTLAAPPLLTPWLSAVLCDFLLAWPAVQVVLGEGAEADVIIAGQPPADTALAVHPLPGTQRVLCASPRYLAARPAPAEPDELRGHACLLVGSSPAGTWVLPGGAAVPVAGPLAAADCATLRAAALAGLGVAWLPRIVVADALAAGSLTPLLAAHTASGSPLLAIIARPSAGARALVDFLRSRL